MSFGDKPCLFTSALTSLSFASGLMTKWPASSTFYLKRGLLANGENGQGIANRMIIRPIENHKSMVLNFSESSSFRFAFAEPMVTNKTATSIMEIWISSKKERSELRDSRFLTLQNILTSGFVVYKRIPRSS